MLIDVIGDVQFLVDLLYERLEKIGRKEMFSFPSLLIDVSTDNAAPCKL